MSLYLRRRTNFTQQPLFLHHSLYSRLNPKPLDVFLHLRCASNGRRTGGLQKRLCREQGLRPIGGSLPLPGLPNSPPHFMPTVHLVAHCGRAFFSVTAAGDSGSDSDGIEGVSVSSTADPDEEVVRVCKVIDELFALDWNMEAVLDECGVQLSHDLVVAVLKRLQHAQKPAFRFFCWAGDKPGFEHDSTTYNSMMSILGKTRQFETMVSLLEEMGVKGRLTMETFVIAFKAFAAAKERKKAVGIFELMKYYRFKYGVDTVNCLLDTLAREKLGKEMQLLFDKLKGRFTPNLHTYAVLLNGWCKVKNLMEAGRVWNEMMIGFPLQIKRK